MCSCHGVGCAKSESPGRLTFATDMGQMAIQDAGLKDGGQNHISYISLSNTCALGVSVFTLPAIV